MNCRALLATAFALIAAPAFAAENLIVSVSNYRVTITPDYSGEELVLFGSVEGAPAQKKYDMVVTVSGPRSDMVTRRKAQVLGIWINKESREFIRVPTYLGIFSNKPVDQIAVPDVQRRLQLGLDNVPLLQHVGIDYADVVASDPFRQAFVRLRSERGLYRSVPDAVSFLTPTLFRTTIPIPAEVPIGLYDIDIKLLADGALAAKTQTTFEIVKVGFEQFVAQSAQHHALLYGLVTAMMAVMVGWLGSVVFRRD